MTQHQPHHQSSATKIAFAAALLVGVAALINGLMRALTILSTSQVAALEATAVVVTGTQDGALLLALALVLFPYRGGHIAALGIAVAYVIGLVVSVVAYLSIPGPGAPITVGMFMLCFVLIGLAAVMSSMAAGRGWRGLPKASVVIGLSAVALSAVLTFVDTLLRIGGAAPAWMLMPILLPQLLLPLAAALVIVFAAIESAGFRLTGTIMAVIISLLLFGQNAIALMQNGPHTQSETVLVQALLTPAAGGVLAWAAVKTRSSARQAQFVSNPASWPNSGPSGSINS